MLVITTLSISHRAVGRFENLGGGRGVNNLRSFEGEGFASITAKNRRGGGGVKNAPLQPGDGPVSKFMRTNGDALTTMGSSVFLATLGML